MLGIDASFDITMKAGIRPIAHTFYPAMFEEALKKVASDGQARRNQLKKRSLHRVNEHFESDFNAAWPSAVVFQNFLNGIPMKIINMPVKIILVT